MSFSSYLILSLVSPAKLNGVNLSHAADAALCFFIRGAACSSVVDLGFSSLARVDELFAELSAAVTLALRLFILLIFSSSESLSMNPSCPTCFFPSGPFWGLYCALSFCPAPQLLYSLVTVWLGTAQAHLNRLLAAEDHLVWSPDGRSELAGMVRVDASQGVQVGFDSGRLEPVFAKKCLENLDDFS